MVSYSKSCTAQHKLRQTEDMNIHDLIQQEVIHNFDNKRSDVRNIAKEN